jgi:hypothetical protein
LSYNEDKIAEHWSKRIKEEEDMRMLEIIDEVIYRWWYARLRQIDFDILWPICKDKTESLEDAKEVFSTHTLLDYAWFILTDEERIRIIENLK